ncbi:hypothetical protein B1808_01705 [Pseudofulvimonas gallinarii]|nr:hypothetical protein B1808_01705 [Pseudofulvimonas gallinarii]
MPEILVTASEHARLTTLAEHALDRNQSVATAERLLDELSRARIVADDALPDDTTAVGREIDYFDRHSGRTHTVRLVNPPDADIDAGRISVLSPIGAALLGLSVGQEIEWPVPDGSVRRIEVRAVRT